MRLVALMGLLAFGCGCVPQPGSESKSQEWYRASQVIDCTPYAPNQPITLRPDFEAGLIEPNHFPKPRCWYETPSGELLLRAGQPPSTAERDGAEACAVSEHTHQAISESADAMQPDPQMASSKGAVVLQGYDPDKWKGHVMVCYRNQGFGWNMEKVSIFTSN